jgi:hypothetical protein
VSAGHFLACSAFLLLAMTRATDRPAGDSKIDRKERFKTALPLYPLETAPGLFGDFGGWIRVDGTLDERMFVARVVGRSMEPHIPDGSLCVFRARPTDSPQGNVFLVQYQGPADPTGGSYTLRRYHAEKADNQPIVLTADFEQDVAIVAELVSVLSVA